MVGQLILYHLPEQPQEGIAPWFTFRTCLRNIVLGASSWERPPVIGSGAEEFRGEAAYGFLLEVICGLRSPVKGETEVLGQFRSQVAAYMAVAPELWRPTFHALSNSLLQDAKTIRSQFLRGLGSQSYGSLTRRLLQHQSAVSIMGSGQLAMELLPWLTDGRRALTVFCRELGRAGELQKRFPAVALATYPAISAGAVVVAAPLPTAALEAWVEKAQPSLMLDLRHSSRQQPVRGAINYIGLDDFFSQLQAQGEGVDAKLLRAAQAAAELAKRRFNRVDHRPFGWDDLCA